jgi:hypothetical protein
VVVDDQRSRDDESPRVQRLDEAKEGVSGRAVRGSQLDGPFEWCGKVMVNNRGRSESQIRESKDHLPEMSGRGETITIEGEDVVCKSGRREEEEDGCTKMEQVLCSAVWSGSSRSQRKAAKQ